MRAATAAATAATAAGGAQAEAEAAEIAVCWRRKTPQLSHPTHQEPRRALQLKTPSLSPRPDKTPCLALIKGALYRVSTWGLFWVKFEVSAYERLLSGC